MKRIVVILAILLLFAGCKKLFEDYDERTYYDVIGIGYVYNEKTREAVPDAQVSVRSGFKSNGWATAQPVTEHYPADSNGYFCIKFLKRTKREDVVYRSIYAYTDDLHNSNIRTCSSEDLQNAKNIIQIDTIWIY